LEYPLKRVLNTEGNQQTRRPNDDDDGDCDCDDVGCDVEEESTEYPSKAKQKQKPQNKRDNCVGWWDSSHSHSLILSATAGQQKSSRSSKISQRSSTK